MALAMPGRSRPSPSRSSVDDPPPSICCGPAKIFRPRPLSICRGPAKKFCPRTYEIAVRMPIFQEEVKGKGKVMVDRWYVIGIGVGADGRVFNEEPPIKPIWKGNLSSFCSFAALGPILYCIGPCSDVCKRDINGPTTGDWIPVPSMTAPRLQPHRLVLGSKLYVLGSDTPSNTAYAEVFYPRTNKWEALPDPPRKLAYEKISAALVNPDRILVASLVPGEDDYDSISSAMFYVYDVGHGSWKVLEPSQRLLHPKCPLGSRGRAVAVANFLYWITDDYQLLCYDLDSDLWLLGHLDGLVIPSDEPHLPGLVHLENHRFCVLQCPIADDHCCHYVECCVFDVTHMPEVESLGVSLVWIHKYKTEDPSTITECFLLDM